MSEGNASRNTRLSGQTSQRISGESYSCCVDFGEEEKAIQDSGAVKGCMLATVDEVINDDKMKLSVTSANKNVSLSDTSNIRRVELQATDVFEMLVDEVKKVDVMSIAVDFIFM